MGVCSGGGVCSFSAPGEVSGPGGGGVPGPGGLVSQHALRQIPPGETATAADVTIPTGMHSCLEKNFAESCVKMIEIEMRRGWPWHIPCIGGLR